MVDAEWWMPQTMAQSVACPLFLFGPLPQVEAETAGVWTAATSNTAVMEMKWQARPPSGMQKAECRMQFWKE